jgi:hypothetical protein
MSVNIHGKEYRTVAERINLFYEQYGKMNTSIITEIVKDDGNIVQIKATIKVDDDKRDGTTSFFGTGYAEEDRSKGRINSTSALENCETSAIGRALASIGLGGEEYASADEVANAIAQQNQKKIAVNNGGQFDKTQKKPNQDLVEALEKDEPLLNGTVDQAKQKMTNGNAGTIKDAMCNFKKHKGKMWSQVAVEDIEYIEWVVGNMDLNSDTEEILNQFV